MGPSLMFSAVYRLFVEPALILFRHLFHRAKRHIIYVPYMRLQFYHY